MAMTTDVRAIRTYFAKLGLEAEIADIYLALHTHGPQSISQLSRNAHVERTRIYRLIDQLMDSNLIEVESHQKRGIVKAAPIANLHILISRKEQDLKNLQDELGLIEQVLARNSVSTPVTRVQTFEGPEAAKQVRHNMLNAHSEVLSLLYKDLHEEFDQPFVTQWIDSANRQGLSFRSIHGFKDPLAHQTAAEVSPPNSWEVRVTPDNSFPINLNMFIYDDVVATLQWHGKTAYGLEIHNDEYTKNQSAFFELLWKQSHVVEARPR